MTTVGPPGKSSLGKTLSTLGERLAGHESLLVGVDFDRTLAPAIRHPDGGSVRPKTRRFLRALGEDERTTVAVFSGRAPSEIRSRVGVDGLAYVGNHGFELRLGRRTTVHPCAERNRARIQRLRQSLADALAHVPGVTVENRGWTAAIDYRDAPDERVPEVRETARAVIAGRSVGNVKLRAGRRGLELLPAAEWDRGRAMALLADRRGERCLPVYVGEGRRDESAFRRSSPAASACTSATATPTPARPSASATRGRSPRFSAGSRPRARTRSTGGVDPGADVVARSAPGETSPGGRSGASRKVYAGRP